MWLGIKNNYRQSQKQAVAEAEAEAMTDARCPDNAAYE